MQRVLPAVELWDDAGAGLLEAMFAPFPPIRGGVTLARRVRAAGGMRFLRAMLAPVRRWAEEEFSGPGGALLLAGCALHADMSPETTGSGLYGWLLAMLGQRHGFPVSRGGAGNFSAAMVRRLESRGGRVRCGTRVVEVVVRRGRAVGVRTAAGDMVPARRAVLADVAAPLLYGGLVSFDHLPAAMRDDMRRFQWDWATVKVDWLLDGPVPWAAPDAGLAGTVHLASDIDEMTRYAADIACGQIPAAPFLLLGQMTTSDATRSPAGTEQLWAYTHVPREVRGDPGGSITGRWDGSDRERMADRIEERVERFAPGFRDLVRRRHVLAPPQLEEHDANLVGGAIYGGTAQPHQQVVFRPAPGLGRPETPVRGLYLASASAHPGGGVHGACGANAARAALRHGRLGRRALAAVQKSSRQGDRRHGDSGEPGH